jgi:tetratricopeptide (TPR) repeat protein
LEFFEKATQLAPQNVVYYNLWAQTLYLMGQYEQAEEILQTSLDFDSKFVQTPMLLGDNYAAMGRPQDAARAHRTAILLSPGAFADQFLDTRLNFYLSAPQDAPGSVGDIISAFDEARAIHSTNVVIPRTLGHIHTRMGEHQEAISYYQQALTMGDEDIQTLFAIADAYLALEDFENAAQAYREVLRRNPEHVQAHSNLGYVYARLGRPEEAIQENLQVLALSPEDYVSQRNLVLLYRDLGRLDEAIQQAENMTQVTPDSERGNTYYLLGTLYEAAERPDEAIAAYRESVAADPNLFQAQATLGNLYLGQGRLEEALPAFQAVAQLNPDDYAVHQQLALIYQQLGRYDEALAEANQALDLAPDDVKESLQQLVSQIEEQRGS